ncbi:hypothetical protein VNO77_02058 [Canavalia gladiata]|uniref:TIR domain-containing protein n=1 Tax=Canavalia gladiata TaxID=3824 RepID=A0AAN9MYP7_CANGL
MDLHPSSSSFSYAFTYDVFLSFRGSDTRHTFTGYLHKALCDKGIHTFIDDEELQRGDEITPALFKAIQESRIAISVFSINYASSSFCLDELVTIIDYIKTKGRLVLPVFYNVDPSHVRHQTGTYDNALAEHEGWFKNNKEKFEDNMKRLQKWKTALTQVANLSGYHYKLGDGYEHEFIGKIVEEVSRKVSRALLPVADYPVGLDARVLKVKSLLDVGSDDGVHIIGEAEGETTEEGILDQEFGLLMTKGLKRWMCASCEREKRTFDTCKNCLPIFSCIHVWLLYLH